MFVQSTEQIFSKNFSSAIPVLFRPHLQPVDEGIELFPAQTDLSIFADRKSEPTGL
jgi:hypothetical protein